ncbi:RADIAL SPOKE HEAD 10-like protein B-LIKE [Salix koriyanagi]|uniref:RADIAL SPOKE HEAD 10-like protein B-LIKE n=1 Tax=Salix koriyanagi TaxID=2511006 RepID=A0A9Q0YRX2_9ROSI|nr:RADIAL SPOKE HEAD 10-like protein B-LIKE [Salix koriyanagi]
MDAQKSSQTKLTRTQSSLRSSPTIRSSIHSLTSVAEEDVIKAQQQQQQQQQKLEDDLEEQKKTKPGRCGSTPRRTGSTRFTAVFTMVSLLFFTFFSLSFLFFFYMRREEIPTSENLLLALIFIAITLFFASKNKNLINQNIIVFKQLWEENTKRLHLCTSRTKSRQVQWFIGDPNVNNRDKDKKLERRIIREGVEFYSNGDFYEGEFHKGKCNGSGVYNFFVNGRYEGDWVDGRYDGYGIESWARGSRYRGQYRQGLRHGYGVYTFYTRDSYAGEWFNGQSHGVGVQTCADGSCYVGEFKCAVKHGLGVYHFRNGDRYAGEYFGDKMHGFGIYHFANGHCYEGSWHEGRKQGYGMYTFRGGDTRCGEWDVGNLRTSLPPLTDPVLRAVQSARRTAENAIHLRRVDELVNKAVHAANRAATAARVAAVKAVQNRIDGKFCDTNV